MPSRRPSGRWNPWTGTTGSGTGGCARTPCAALVSVSAEELAELVAAATALDRAGLAERAAMLRDLAAKLQATLREESRARVESDLEMLAQAEGLAMRPGPREHLDPGLLALLREAITTRREVEFRYFAQSDEAAEPAAGPAPRPALREPRVPGGVDRLGGGAAAVAPRERGRGPDHRRGVRAGPGLRSATLRRAFVRRVFRRSPSRWCCASMPRRRGTPRRSCSIRTRASRRTKTAR